MSPVLHLCPSCGKTHTQPGRCAACGPRPSEAKRYERRKSSGRASRDWTKLRAVALANNPFCEHCDSPYDLTVHHLYYPATRLEDVQVLCRSCHGRLDQTKQTAKGGVGMTRSPSESVGSSRVDLQACKLEYSIVSPK